MIIRFLTGVRHGRLRSLKLMWVAFRFIYRMSLHVPIEWTASKYVGPYGPYRFHRRFAFSNFDKFGGNLSGKNRGFQAFVNACEDKTCVFDIGAHVGLVTLPASSMVSKGGLIYSFEPSPGNVKYLKYHLEKNEISNVVVIPKLVGATDSDSVQIFLAPEDSDMNTIAPDQLQATHSARVVSSVSIDTYCSENNLRPELIKIDVEGAELNVLEGASHVLASARPTLYLSVHPKYIKAVRRSTTELKELLAASGYTVSDFDGNSVDVAMSEDDSEYLVAPANP